MLSIHTYILHTLSICISSLYLLKKYENNDEPSSNEHL